MRGPHVWAYDGQTRLIVVTYIVIRLVRLSRDQTFEKAFLYFNEQGEGGTVVELWNCTEFTFSLFLNKFLLYLCRVSTAGLPLLFRQIRPTTLLVWKSVFYAAATRNCCNTSGNHVFSAQWRYFRLSAHFPSLVHRHNSLHGDNKNLYDIHAASGARFHALHLLQAHLSRDY
jgi:hypothetical protein